MLIRSFVAFVMFVCAAAAQETTAIVGATVIDGTGRAPAPATVVIRDGQIVAVGANVQAPAGARIIDAKGQTLLPGLFDLHTHLLASPGEGQPGDWGKILKAYLYSGVTTVADMGTYGEQLEPMRRLIANGLAAPKLLMAVRFSSPGGHGAEGGRGDFHTQEVQTEAEARAAVAHILPYKPDLLKIFTDGWRYGVDLDMTSMNEPALRALVDEGHKQGIRSVTHTVTVGKAKIAVRSQVDAIIHGLGDEPVDEELITIVRAGKTAYVPTLAVYETHVFPNGAPPLLAELLPASAAARLTRSLTPSAARRQRWANLTSSVKRLRDAGMLVGCGTDSGMTSTYHGYATQHEVALLVASGLTPLEAITAATGNSARIIGVAADRGTIEPGRAADLLLVEGAPHQKIEDLMRIRRVFLNGRELDRAALRQSIHSVEPTPMPARKIAPLLDDFEAPNGRSRIGTLWVNSTDAGHDHSLMSYQVTERSPGDHALTILARMSEKEEPVAAMMLPLSPGAVEPVDLSAYSGIEFDARGGGDYGLRLVRRAGAGRLVAESLTFRAGADWSQVKLAFAGRHKDVVGLQFRIARKAGEKGWLELDNVRLVK